MSNKQTIIMLPSYSWGPFLCIYEGLCNIRVLQIEQYICLLIRSYLVEDCKAVTKQQPEEHLLQKKELLFKVEQLLNLD